MTGDTSRQALRAPLTRAPRSMAQRLTLALTLLAVAVFVAVALLLHSGLQQEVERARDHDLEGKIDVVEHLLEEVRVPADVPALTHHLNDVLIGHGQMRIWLLDRDGRVLYGGSAPPEMSTIAGRLEVRREDGLSMQARQVSLEDHPVLGKQELIVAIDSRDQEAMLRRYGTRLAIVCGVGVALIVMVAGLIARRSLRPVQQLSEEAAALNPRSLSARLTPVETAELQELVQAFNSALGRVEAAYSQLEGFSADVAHELRTPLATMISSAEVALIRERPAAELREVLATNLEVLRELSSLVNDMLFLAKADQGLLADQLVLLDLRTQAQHISDYFEPLFEEQGVRLLVEGDARAAGNAGLVRRALVNLVGNAARYTPHGEAIFIELASPAPNLVRVSVRNPGPAIPPELLPRLFDRFVRGDPARGQSSNHHGLGLAIVRAVAIMHGGRVFARSENGWTVVGLEWPPSGVH
ncbi:heavy metal sensor histidine kinase [Mitsuaria sp. GD03876]|uniref:heavy metal sensor histidine kinase n=1 Tax=Mitsuaria sp. GD03876 TaxID=2975399 RepID=UPI0024494047|nr:heavy metal sensor histidine kinase [Mitsuaria sp. GD03876]MDH0863649.1 heavy metal sensor histidine kinase [Mitsuaria sp. GD03876]